AQRLAIFDLYQQLHPRPALLDIPVRVVEIDEAALRARGQWPWPRTDLAALVDRLSALGAAVVVLDVILAEYDRTSPTHILKAWPKTPETAALAGRLLELPDHDAVLAESLAATAAVGAVALLPGEEGTQALPPRRAGFAYGGSDPL